MRPASIGAFGTSFRGIRGRVQAAWVCSIVILTASLARAAAAVICDVGANSAHDLLNGWVGRTGEWLIIAGVLRGMRCIRESALVRQR